MKKRTILFMALWMMGFMALVQSPKVRAASSGKDTKTVTATTPSAVEVDKDKAETKKYTLYRGQKVKLSGISSGKVTVDNTNVITVSDQYVAQAVGKGTAKVYVSAAGGNVLFAEITVKDNELLTAVTFNPADYSAWVLGKGTFIVEKQEFQSCKCVYTSTNPKVATVSATGIVTPLMNGQTTIHIAVTDAFGGVYEYDIPVQILEPNFSKSKLCLAKGCDLLLTVENTGGIIPEYSSSNTGVAEIKYSDEKGVMVTAKKKGTAIITAVIEGVSYTCKITVTDPDLKQQYGFYQKNKSFTIKLSGTNSGSDIQWTSENTKIATVNKKGKVHTIKMGSTVIHCSVDGRTLSYYLAVSTKTAVAAMKYGYTQLGKKKYSQARRMSTNYYDCSSFVYRTYRAVGKYLVRRTSWAPVAAEIGQYYVRKGKRVKASGKYYDWDKLRPGDLVCFGGSSARRNGRYQRIYHIAMYIGNGKTMESSSLYNNVVIRDREPLKKKEVPVVVRPA